MSEFDKEKEREKLREQLAADEQRRQTTKQMSELLLKGATMLNIHCDQCASPLFRYEGDEFCPTCERTVSEIQNETTAEQQPEPAAAEEQVPHSHQEQHQPVEPSAGDQTPDREPSAPESPSPRQVPQTNAGEALEATISRLADRAATAEDPRQAAELLEAAQTAAETLTLVEGQGQSGS